MLHRVRRIRDLFIPGVFGLLVLITLICVLAGCAGSSTHSTLTVDTGTSSQATGAGGSNGLGTVAVGELPSQARTTMELIEAGGPFPYRQDGVVFGNREHLLPREPSGYYHEYTVKTPGSRDRGARRIIKARDGTLYYTADHYKSFRRIVS